jgi:hypothetical protein
MPDVQSSALRIYCLCGQKMRVSEKMYGLPGKCVACRQKIRIPRKEDVPEGVFDIYLKDHPELVRGPVKAPSAAERAASKAMAKAGRAPDEGEESTPNTELDLVDSPPPPDTPQPPKPKRPSRGSLPLDVLPMLQVLCSLDYKFSRQLDTLQLDSHDDEVLLAELEGHVTRVRKLRSQLDDQLHQRLMETAIELANTQEKLAQARLGARVGEMTWADYYANVHRLRTRRDRLERRQQNLRGWLAARDPYIAGGLLDLSVENIPQEGFTLSLPAELGDETLLLAELIEGLRNALDHRTRVRQRAAEVQKMAEIDAGREIEELRKECEQQRLMARAGVAFAHDRLQQLKKDYTADNETANAMLASARDKLRMDTIARPEYDAFERAVMRSKKDFARAQAVIDRALGANAAADVPSAQGTFLQRLGVGGSRRNTPDVLLAYGSAILLVLGIFTPSIGTLSLVSAAMNFGAGGGLAVWLVLLPLALAAAAGASAFLGNAVLRGRTYLVAWLAGFVAAAYLIHESAYSLDPIAARFRAGTQWYLRPGIVLTLAGIFGLFVASVAALWPGRKYRVWPIAAALLGIAAAGLIASDAAGTFRPGPGVEVALRAGDTGAGVVRVRNEGGRAIRLLDRRPDARGSYLFMIERRRGATSVDDAHGQGPLWDGSLVPRDGVLYTVRPGGVEEIPFVLPPGEYRAVLYPAATDAPLAAGFAIRAPAPPEGPAPAPAASAPGSLSSAPAAGSAGGVAASAPLEENTPPPADAGEIASAPEEEAPAAAAPQDTPAADANGAPIAAPTVELAGVVTSEGQEPRFSLRVRYADGTEDRLVMGIGGVVWGDWAVTEFNSEQTTVTLQGAKGLVILRRRVQVPLDPAVGPVTR